MKHLPAILFISAAAILLAPSPAQAAPILDFAVRVGCDFQQPERGLMDLHFLQGSTPLVLAMPKSGNYAITPDTDTSVRMIIGPSETGSIYAVRTNYAIAGGGYAIDWPTIGTNSSGQAWFYTLLFDREGKTYWSGSGALYIDASTYTGPDGVDWIEYTTPNVGWANVVGDPADNAALVQYVEAHGGGSAEDTVARAAVAGVESNLTAHATDTNNPHGVTAEQIGALTAEEDAAALAAVAGVESNVTALAETVGGITAESLGALTAETDPAWTAASGSVVYATTPGYTAAVEQAASAYGWGDHSAAGYLTEETDTAALSAVAAVSGRVDTVEGWGDHSEAGYATTKAAGEIATNVVGAATNALLDLAGTRAMTGNVVTLARDVKSRDAASVGEYGAAFGDSTTAGYAGAAFGEGTTAGEYGAAFGEGTTAGEYGAAFGEGTAAGTYGAAFGASTTAGEYGFSAGRDAHGSTGSFVFADSAPVAFDRTNSPNSFSVRAAGGTYFDTPLFTVTGEVAVESNLVVGTGIINDSAISNWNAAYGWGDHADAGYLTAETDSTALGQGFATTNAAGQIATNVVGAATNALLDLAGTRAMTGNLNMGSRSISNVAELVSGDGLALDISEQNEVRWGGSFAILHDGGTNVWQGRVNDTEASRIAALAEEAAEVLLTAATNALLDLAGTRAMTGDGVTLARDVKSRDAASVGEYGAAFGDSTTAGYAGAAFGEGTTAGEYGAAFGEGTTAGEYGAAFGEGTAAGTYGAAFGAGTTAGEYGFSAGRNAHGSTGSFVFADSAPVAFNRTNSPNSFNVRAAGGTYFDTPLFTVTGEVAVESNLVVGNGQVFLNSSGTSWLQLDGTNIQFRATNGVTGRIQIIYE